MRGYDYRDAENARRARRLLKDLTPRARVMARSMAKDAQYEDHTKLGEVTRAHVRFSNVEAVHVYRNEVGGWIADLVLKRVPEGVPNIVGTPVMYPAKTREEAVGQAVSMLAMALVEDARPKRASDERWMSLHGFSFRVPGEVIDKAAALAAIVPPPSQERARERLDQICGELFDGPPTEEKLNALSDEQRLMLWTLVAVAMTVGVVRHPEWEARSPEAVERAKRKMH